jgi:lipopolysaccharide export LptBFGC system permease protein LptF
MKNPKLLLALYLLSIPLIALYISSDLGEMRRVFLFAAVFCIIGVWIACIIDAIKDKKLNPIWLVLLFAMSGIAVPVYLYKKHQLNKSLQH